MLNEYLRLYHEKEYLFEGWSAASDKLYEQQSKILQEFGLPDQYPYLQCFIRLIYAPNRENAIKEAIVNLHNFGKEYSRQEPKHNLQILRDAKRNFTEARKVLSLLGVYNSTYAEYIYREVFLTGREDEKTCLTILKEANTYEDLENLLYFHQHIRTISKEINLKEIPYLTEFLRQEPENEELINLLNPQWQITKTDEDSRTYRSHLIKTRDLLDDIGQQLFTCLVNVAMSGELQSADDFEIGDVLNFKETDFRSLDDQNAQLIIKVLDAISQSSASIININNLDSNSENDSEPPF